MSKRRIQVRHKLVLRYVVRAQIIVNVGQRIFMTVDGLPWCSPVGPEAARGGNTVRCFFFLNE